MAVPRSEVVNVELIPSNDEISNQGNIAMVTINRPNKLNALNSEVMNSLKEICHWVESEDSVRCVVFTGAKPLKGFQNRYIYLIDKKLKINVPIIPFNEIDKRGAGM